MAHLIFEAARALYDNGLLSHQQYSSFYQHSNPIPSGIFYSIRQNLDETNTILCPEALGKPLDEGYKIEKMQSVLEGLTEFDRFQLGVNPGPVLYDKLEKVMQHEISSVVDFCNYQSYGELLSYGGLSKVYNQLFPNQPVPIEQDFYDAPCAEQMSQRFSQVVRFLMTLSRPLHSYKLLPCSQNFCAWLSPEVVKENHLRIASALLKIEDAISKLSYVVRNGIHCDQNTQTEFSNWRDQIHNARRVLASQSMVIVKQPDHCCKRGVKNVVKIQLLAHAGHFSLPSDPPEVTVTVLDDATARLLFENGQVCAFIEQQGQRMSATCKEYTLQGGVAEMKLNVKIPRRAPWIGRDVLNHKYYLLIQVALPAINQFAPFGCQNGGVVPSPSSFNIWACSSPIVLITNVCQVPDASRTIFWDFHAHPLNQFQSPVEATFSQIRVAFIEFTKFITQTTWELPPSNVNYLVQTVFGVANVNNPGRILRRMIRPERRQRLEQLQERWLLYFKSLTLIKSKLREPWGRGFIMGFISRELAEQIVRQRGHGNFLLRFSTSQAGRLAITDNFNRNSPESGVFSSLEVDHLSRVLHSHGYWPQNVLHWDHQLQGIVSTSKNDAFRSRGIEARHLLSYPRLWAINFAVVQPQ